MLQCLLVRAIFLGGKLFSPLVELRGHIGGFFRRTAERDENLGELENIHGEKFIKKARTQETESELFLFSCVPDSTLFI